MPLGIIRAAPPQQPVPLPVAGPSRLCALPTTSEPQRWDEAGHEVDAAVMDVDSGDLLCSHAAGTPELVSCSQSLTLQHALSSTRQRHLTSLLPRVFSHPRSKGGRARPFSGVEYFPAISFHTVSSEPMKGKGKHKAIQDAPQPVMKDGPPAHELNCVGWCGMQVGPVEYDGVSIWIGKFVRDRPGDGNVAEVQKREKERKDRERKERDRQAQAQAADKRQQQQRQANAAKPADIPLTLIQKVNQAASQHPWIATLIHKAAKHEASKEELTQLGRVVSTLQAQLAAAESSSTPAGSAPATPSAASTSTSQVAKMPATAPSSGSAVAFGSAGKTNVSVVVPSSKTPVPAAPLPLSSTSKPNNPAQTNLGPPPNKPMYTPSPTYLPPRPRPPPPEVPSLPFIVLSFRDNIADKFLIPLGSQSFISRVPWDAVPASRGAKRKKPFVNSFPVWQEDAEDAMEVDENPWEQPPTPGTVLISIMVPLKGWLQPTWPARPKAVVAPQPQSQQQPVPGPPKGTPQVNSAKPSQTPSVIPGTTPATQVAPALVSQGPAGPPTPSMQAPISAESAFAPVLKATKANSVAGTSNLPPACLNPTDAGLPRSVDSSTALPSAIPSTAVSSVVTAPTTPVPSAMPASSVAAPPVVTSSGAQASASGASGPASALALAVSVPPAPVIPPVYPPLIRLSTTSLIPIAGPVRPVTIRLTGITDATWRAMQDTIRVVDYDENGDLARDDPPAVPPGPLPPSHAIAPADLVSESPAADKLTRAAEEERRKEAEKRQKKLQDEYEAKEAARKAKITQRYEKKAIGFVKLMERVPARRFLKHRLDQAMPELEEAETDKFAARLYNIYPKSRFGLPPPAYRSTMDDTTQLEIDLAEPSAAVAPVNPRKRKAEPAVAFEVPMSFEEIDQAVEQQARRAATKAEKGQAGTGGSRRRKSGIGEDGKRTIAKRSTPGTICEGCGSSKQRVWRKGPGGKATLCKVCGDKFMAGTLGPLVAPGAATQKPQTTNAAMAAGPIPSSSSAPPPHSGLVSSTAVSGAPAPISANGIMAAVGSGTLNAPATVITQYTAPVGSEVTFSASGPVPTVRTTIVPQHAQMSSSISQHSASANSTPSVVIPVAAASMPRPAAAFAGVYVRSAPAPSAPSASSAPSVPPTALPVAASPPVTPAAPVQIKSPIAQAQEPKFPE